MTTALITGVAGQDGILLARYLAARGYRVVGTVTDQGRATPLVTTYAPTVDLVELDLRDTAAMGVLLDREKPDEIYNLASWSSVGRSWGHAETVTAINGLAVLGLLEQLRRLRDRSGYNPRILQASSSEMFGLAIEQPQHENSPHHPRSPYAVSKSFAHHTSVNYRESYDMFIASTILFNHESPLRPASFVTRKITSAVAEISLGQRSTLELGQLDVYRDWGAASDYVVAMHAALQHDEPDTFVVATGQSHSLWEFLEIAFACAGIDDPRSHVTSDPALLRPADVPETRGDAGKAHRLLGWRPTRTFEQIIAAMVRADIARLTSGVAEDPAYLD